MDIRKTIAAGLLLFAVFSHEKTAFARPEYYAGQTISLLGENFYRTELYFGRSKPGGGAVTDEEWNKFLLEIVTPRFPEGFTILSGRGQYREATGKIITEPTNVLIFLYTGSKRTPSRRKIEEIRRAYVKQFQQESVLRMDLRQSVQVYF